MTAAPAYRDLFTRKWRRLEQPQKEVWSLHIPLVQMLRWCLKPTVIWHHCPNGENRDPKTAAKLKAMGILPGWADLDFHWCEMRDGVKHRRLLHLELKVGNRQQSEAQVAFALAVRLLGDEYHIVRSIDEAITILGEHGLIKPNIEVCGRRW